MWSQQREGPSSDIERKVKEFRDQRGGVVKEPGPRIKGRILRVFRDRGYGFVETETHQEVYFHVDSVPGITVDALEVGMAMDLEIEAGEGGYKPLGSLPPGGCAPYW